MVVVVIATILAVIATPLYGGYRRRALAGEAQVNLALIASSEEAYRAEWGVYYGVYNGGSCTGSNPSALTCGQRLDFTSPGGSCGANSCCDRFKQLGFRPENPWVYFRYRVDGGTSYAGTPAWASTWISTGQAYFALEAIADLACGGTETTYRAVSGRSDIVARSNQYE